jgi:hypothetical protein
MPNFREVKMLTNEKRSVELTAFTYFILAAIAFLFAAVYYLPRLEKAYASQWAGNQGAIPSMDILPAFWMAGGLFVLAMVAAIAMTWAQLFQSIPATNNAGRKLRWLYLVISFLWVLHEVTRVVKVTRSMYATSGGYLYASYSEFTLVYDFIGISLASLLLCAAVTLHSEPLDTKSKGMSSFLESIAALLTCFLGNKSLYLYSSACMVLLATMSWFPWKTWLEHLANSSGLVRNDEGA